MRRASLPRGNAEGGITIPSTSLDSTDVLELAELLQFLSDWLAADHGRLAVSLRDFIGNPTYGLSDLRADLDKFVFLLGGDGEQFLGTRS